MNVTERDVSCPECGAKMKLRPSKYGNPYFYGCEMYPDCKGSHGAHPDGRPLGIPAKKETKDMRIAAHEAFDALWKDGYMKRRHAYARLAEKLGVEEVHIGEADIVRCYAIIAAVEEILADIEE